MIRVAVRALGKDALAGKYLRSLSALFPKAKLSAVTVVDTYTVDAVLAPEEIGAVAARLTNPVIEEYALDTIPAPHNFSFAIEIGYLPGVTDNVGHTVEEMIEDVAGRGLTEGEAVYTSRFLFLTGRLDADTAYTVAAELYNPLIQRARVISAAEFRKGVPMIAPKVNIKGSVAADTVNLDVRDEELVRIGKEGIANTDGSRRGPLALSLRALQTIRDHFRGKGRQPTDVELESLAQTWSEHCKHTIFADPLDDIEEGIFKRYIKGATRKIREDKGKKDFCVSVFTDNSGAIAFDDDYLVTHKVETHNSPSALDPFGGAITGIVGVNRDCLGFGLGAKPIANTYGFCVGDPEDTAVYFRDEAKTRTVLPERRILEGVVAGVNAGGNQSGIPTPLGFVATDHRFNAKPLVFAGTVGLIPRKAGNKKLHEKRARPGDLIVVIGGRVGLDGIHGATFSSEGLTSGSPATAVQIGDPITQKKFSDALIREARDRDLYSSITDNGAGGLSSSVGEMARDCGGCIVDLDKVPLKYPGLAPWQIWISESQERMTLAVPPPKWDALKDIFDRHGVEATPIGEFTNSSACVVRYRGKTVMDLALDFLHDGRPVEHQRSRAPARPADIMESTPKQNLGKRLVEILSRPSIAGTAFIARQYDHEVQGTSVTKPLQGRGQMNADAAILRPRLDSERGIVMSHGYCPWYSDIDAYAMAAAAIDTAVRNAVCAGASLDHLAILDNFCWSSSNTPERLYELKEAARACYDVAVAYGTPFISGKDSMFNDFRGFEKDGKSIHIAVPPTLLISALGVVADVRKTVTLDLKQPGDLLYLVGETNDELGASEYSGMFSEKYGHGVSVFGEVPRVNLKKNIAAYRALSAAIEKGLVASALGVGRGGLGVALAKTAIAGQLGIKADLTKLPGGASNPASILFSESQGRVLVSIRLTAKTAFERQCQGVAFTLIGKVTKKEALDLKLPSARLLHPLKTLADAYRNTFKNW